MNHHHQFKGGGNEIKLDTTNIDREKSFPAPRRKHSSDSYNCLSKEEKSRVMLEKGRQACLKQKELMPDNKHFNVALLKPFITIINKNYSFNVIIFIIIINLINITDKIKAQSTNNRYSLLQQQNQLTRHHPNQHPADCQNPNHNHNNQQQLHPPYQYGFLNHHQWSNNGPYQSMPASIKKQPPINNNHPHQHVQYNQQLVQLRSPTLIPTTMQNIYLIRENELNLLTKTARQIQIRQNEQQQQQQRNANFFQNEQFIVHQTPEKPPLVTTILNADKKITNLKTTTEQQQQQNLLLINTKTTRQQQQNINNNKNNILIDIDECLDERACGRGASCENLPGSFRCACPPGFTGDPMLECIGK